MSLTFGLNPLLLAACLLGAAGLTYWTYRATVPPLASFRRWVLMTLRFGALFLILFLLFEPILRQRQRITQPPVLAVLVDESQSIRLADGGDSDHTGQAILKALAALPTDRIPGEVRFFGFSHEAHPLAEPRPDSLPLDGVRTNIAGGLDFVRDALKDANLKGVVLLSDGQYNMGRNPLYVAERYPVPVYTVAVGDTSSRRDVQVRRVNTNQIAYVGREMPLQVGIRSDGFGGERVSVTLLVDGAVQSTRSLVLPDGTAETTLDLTYTPETVGLKQVRVAVGRLDGEVTYENNLASVLVRVLERKRRILLLADGPGPDLAALRQLLDRDPDTDVEAYVQKNRTGFYEGAPPDSFTDFDLILLAGYPGPEADTAILQRIAGAAAGDVPVLFLLDRRTDLARVRRHLGEVFPAVPERIRPGVVETAFVPSPGLLDHPIFDIPDVPAASIRRLPPLRTTEARWTAAPDARILATTEVRGIPLDDPLLVIRKRGRQRSAALLGSGTWRWKNVPEDLQDAAPFWPALLENLIQWVTTREDDRPVRVTPTSSTYGGGEPVQLTGEVYDESLNPVNDASLEVELVSPEGNRLPYLMEALGNGRYMLDLGSLPEGTYQYTAAAQRDQQRLGEDQGSFAVGALTLEFSETRANTTLLRQLANRSGGRFFLPSEVDALAGALAKSEAFHPLIIEETRSHRLWQLFPFLIVVVLLLTAEWFIRKRSGMV